jgi:hypothetical protein
MGRALLEHPSARPVVDLAGRLKMMRRILGFLVALGFLSLGPLPLSACALIYSQPSECATPKTEFHCERMEMGRTESPVVLASSKNCCVISQAPQPDAQSGTGHLSIAPVETIESIKAATITTTEKTLPSEMLRDTSPPPLQLLLCTFLI